MTVCNRAVLFHFEMETQKNAQLEMQIEKLNRAVSILTNAGDDMAEECASVAHVNKWDRACEEANRLARGRSLL